MGVVRWTSRVDWHSVSPRPKVTGHRGAGPHSLAWLDRLPAAAATFLGLPYGGGPWRREDSAAAGGVGAGTGPPPRGLSNLSAHGDPGGPEVQPGETEAPKSPGALRLSFFAPGASPGEPFVPGPPASQPKLVRARRRAVPSGSSPGLGRERTYRRGGGQSAGPAGMVRVPGARGRGGGQTKAGDGERGKDKAQRGSAAARGPRRRLRARRSQWAGAGRGPAGAVPR